MFCDEVLDVLEAIAAGEVTVEGRIASHLASCPNCARALDEARRVERMLAARPVPSAPSQFTTRTLSRLRRERWRSEQFVDAGFNIALLVLGLTIVAAAWLVMHRAGLTSFGSDAVDLLAAGAATVVRRVAPSVPLYAGATALLLATLAIWWWAERDAAL